MIGNQTNLNSKPEKNRIWTKMENQDLMKLILGLCFLLIIAFFCLKKSFRSYLKKFILQIMARLGCTKPPQQPQRA